MLGRPSFLIACTATVAVTAAAPASGAVRVTTSVEYGTAQVRAPEARSAPLLLDLYRPAERTRRARPVVILIHGGGFRHQSRKDAALVRVARGLAARGIAAATIDYRLIPQEPVPSARVAPLLEAMPEAPISTGAATAVDDTLTAIRFLRRRASSLQVDVRRLGLVGGSAGAVTAAHVAYVLDDHGIEAPKVRFVGSLWGGIIVPPGARQLDRGEAALFAAHGTADTTVPIRLGDELVARARDQRVRTEYHRLRGGGHGFRRSGFFTAKVAGDQTAFDRLLRFASARLRR